MSIVNTPATVVSPSRSIKTLTRGIFYLPKNKDDRMMMIWSSTRVELSVWARSSELASRPVEFVGTAMIEEESCKINEEKVYEY